MEKGGPSREEGERLERALSEFEGVEGELIPVLRRVQEEFGHVPDWAISEVAKFLGLPESKVFGALTFYPALRREPPRGAVIEVCVGLPCWLNGGRELLEEVRKMAAELGDVEVRAVNCVGCCGVPPVAVVDGRLVGRATPQKVEEALLRGREGS